jgi:predicted transcriptional regulator
MLLELSTAYLKYNGIEPDIEAGQKMNPRGPGTTIPILLAVMLGLALAPALTAFPALTAAAEEPVLPQQTEAAAAISSPQSGSVLYLNQSVMFTSEMINSSTFGEPVEFWWDFGDGASSTLVNPWHAYAMEGAYTILLTIVDRAGNVTTASVNIEVRYPPLPAFSVTIEPSPPEPGAPGNFPAGERLRFSAQPLLMGYSTSRLTYFWDFGDGTVGAGDAPGHAYSQAGTYNVTLTVSDGRSWSVTTNQITVRPAPPLATGGEGQTTYLWFAISLALVAGLVFFFGGTEVGLLALAPVLVFLYSKIQRDEILDNYTRGQIHGYILANPGEHYNAIKNALDINNGTLAYHLKRLETENIVKSRMDGLFRRYYPAGMKMPEPNGDALTEVQRTVLAKMKETPGISQTDIASLMKLSNATINYHIERLLKRGLVRRERAGMRYRCYIVDGATPPEPPHELPPQNT